MQKPGFFNFLADPRNQYDPHAQIVIRLRDQDGLPIPIAQSDVFFVSNQQEKGTIPIQMLIQDTSVSGVSPNSILFYLRVQKFVRKEQDWIDQLRDVFDFALRSPRSSRRRRGTIRSSYLPLRLPLNRRQTERADPTASHHYHRCHAAATARAGGLSIEQIIARPWLVIPSRRSAAGTSQLQCAFPREEDSVDFDCEVPRRLRARDDNGSALI